MIENKMNILLNINREYIMPAVVMLKSLAVNNPDEKLFVYIMHSNLTERDCAVFKENFATLLTICFIYVEDPLFDHLLISGHISKEAYFRVFAFDYLPNCVDRVLYIDSDVIVNKSLKDFYNQNLEDIFLVACEDTKMSHQTVDVYENLSMNLRDPYFNSGLILFNIAKMKQTDGLKSSLYAYIARNCEHFLFHDQDILNGYFYHKPIKIISSKAYNCMIPSILSKKERIWAEKNAVILHFADRWKPWNYDYAGYFDDVFWEYAKQTSFRDSYADYVDLHSKRKASVNLLVRRLKRFIKKMLRKY
jgi:lipopolysaccharide biosynthesis glycosyltransferase